MHCYLGRPDGLNKVGGGEVGRWGAELVAVGQGGHRSAGEVGACAILVHVGGAGGGEGRGTSVLYCGRLVAIVGHCYF